MGVPFYNLKFRGNNPAGGFNPVDYGNEKEAEGEAAAAPSWTRVLVGDSVATSGTSAFNLDSETAGSTGLSTVSYDAVFSRDPTVARTHYWVIPGVTWGDNFKVRLSLFVDRYTSLGDDGNPRQGLVAMLTHRIFDSAVVSGDTAYGFGFQLTGGNLPCCSVKRINNGSFARSVGATSGSSYDPSAASFYCDVDFNFTRQRTVKCAGVENVQPDGTRIQVRSEGVTDTSGIEGTPFPEGSPVYLALMTFGETSTANSDNTAAFRLSYSVTQISTLDS